jgi:hypothetical protein
LKPTQLPCALGSDVTAGSNLELVSRAEALDERHPDEETKVPRSIIDCFMLISADERKNFFISKSLVSDLMSLCL